MLYIFIAGGRALLRGLLRLLRGSRLLISFRETARVNWPGQVLIWALFLECTDGVCWLYLCHSAAGVDAQIHTDLRFALIFIFFLHACSEHFDKLAREGLRRLSYQAWLRLAMVNRCQWIIRGEVEDFQVRINCVLKSARVWLCMTLMMLEIALPRWVFFKQLTTSVDALLQLTSSSSVGKLHHCQVRLQLASCCLDEFDVSVGLQEIVVRRIRRHDLILPQHQNLLFAHLRSTTLMVMRWTEKLG